MYFKLEILETQSGLFLLIFFSLKKKKKVGLWYRLSLLQDSSHKLQPQPLVLYCYLHKHNTECNGQEQKAKLWKSFLGKIILENWEHRITDWLRRSLVQSPAQGCSSQMSDKTTVYSGYSSLVLKTTKNGGCIISLGILFHCLSILTVGKNIRDERREDHRK